MRLTTGDNGVGGNLSHVARGPAVNVRSRSIITEQLVIKRTAVPRPEGHVSAIEILAGRCVAYKSYISSI